MECDHPQSKQRIVTIADTEQTVCLKCGDTISKSIVEDVSPLEPEIPAPVLPVFPPTFHPDSTVSLRDQFAMSVVTATSNWWYAVYLGNDFMKAHEYARAVYSIADALLQASRQPDRN